MEQCSLCQTDITNSSEGCNDLCCDCCNTRTEVGKEWTLLLDMRLEWRRGQPRHPDYDYSLFKEKPVRRRRGDGH